MELVILSKMVCLAASLLFMIYLIQQIVFCFYPTKVKAWWDDNLTEDSQNLKVSEICNQLKSIGFSFIGVKVEKIPLRKPIKGEWSYASEKASCFASVFEIGKSVKYYFYSPFSTGEIVLTSNTAFPDIKTSTCNVAVYRNYSPRELFEAHQESFNKFKLRGIEAYRSFSKESRLLATYQFYNAKDNLKALRKRGFLLLFVLVIVVYIIFKFL